MHSRAGKPECAWGSRGASGGAGGVEGRVAMEGAGRHGRGMMDGSHASHCEKIIAKCRQLRKSGGQPKPRDNKDPGSLRVSERVSAGLPACGAPNLHIYMQRSSAQELIALNSCAGCIVGAVVALFYITNTLFLLIPLCFQGSWTKDAKMVLGSELGPKLFPQNEQLTSVICHHVRNGCNFYHLKKQKERRKQQVRSRWHFMYTLYVIMALSS